MDINNLEAFIKVAETKSFSKSAAELHLTQPAISKRIAALETRLRTRLFDRQSRSVHLTEAGRMLLPSARQIQSEINRILEASCSPDKSFQGTLALGTTPFTTVTHLAPRLKEFHRAFTNVSIDLRLQSTEEIVESLLNNSLELGLCSMTNSSIEDLPASLLIMELLTETLKIVVCKNSPLVQLQAANDDFISSTRLAGTKAILPPANTLERQQIDKKLSHHQCQVEPTPIEAPDFCTMRSLAMSGLGWTLLPENEIDDTLAVLQVKNLEFVHSITLLRRRNRTLSRSANCFLDFLPQSETSVA